MFWKKEKKPCKHDYLIHITDSETKIKCLICGVIKNCTISGSIDD